MTSTASAALRSGAPASRPHLDHKPSPVSAGIFIGRLAAGPRPFNFPGVRVSSRTVAFGIISPLPVELILQAGSGAGFAMVFALLAAAIL